MTEQGESAAPDIPGLIRRVRRTCDLSQPELAALIGVSSSVVGRLETGAVTPQAHVLHELLCMAGLRFTLGDQEGPEAVPMRADAARDRDARQLPAHLDPRPYREFQDVWRFTWQGRERRGTKVGYEHRETRNLRRERDGGSPLDHPETAALQRPRAQPRRPLPDPVECTCPMECERDDIPKSAG